MFSLVLVYHYSRITYGMFHSQLPKGTRPNTRAQVWPGPFVTRLYHPMKLQRVSSTGSGLDCNASRSLRSFRRLNIPCTSTRECESVRQSAKTLLEPALAPPIRMLPLTWTPIEVHLRSASIIFFLLHFGSNYEIGSNDSFES
jgi:hypothetical protein